MIGFLLIPVSLGFFSLKKFTKNLRSDKFDHIHRYLESFYRGDDRQTTMINDLAADKSAEDDIVSEIDDSMKDSGGETMGEIV